MVSPTAGVREDSGMSPSIWPRVVRANSTCTMCLEGGIFASGPGRSVIRRFKRLWNRYQSSIGRSWRTKRSSCSGDSSDTWTESSIFELRFGVCGTAVTILPFLARRSFIVSFCCLFCGLAASMAWRPIIGKDTQSEGGRPTWVSFLPVRIRWAIA